MKKRLFGILLSFAMMLTMIPVLGLSQTAYADTEYPLWVGGERVTSANKDDPGNRGWSYTPADGTTPAKLTLSGYDNKGAVGDKNAAIYAEEDLIIETSGANNVANEHTDSWDCAIRVTRNLTLQGSGTLNATCGSRAIVANAVTIESGNVSTSGGIFGVDGNITINGGVVNASGSILGLQATNDVIIKNGTVIATATDTQNDYVAIVAINNITIEGGTVTASGGDMAISGTVKNSITGTGWSDTAGTEGKEDISVSPEGQTLSYKKVMFPKFVKYPLWVGGTQVTSANMSGDGWSYTPAPNDETPATLTLNNYTYNSGAFYDSAIYANENLTIELVGNNNVDSTLVEANDYAIYVIGQLTIQGSGRLDTKGKRYGIYANRLTIEGCNVIARSTETTEGEYICGGISSANKGDDITIKNATVKANAVVGNAIESGGDVIIEDSTVEAHSTNHIGVFSYEGNVEIKGGSNVIASGGDKAIDGTVKNAIAGTGWTDTEGKEGKTAIAINTEGKELTFKKVQFPAVPDPVKESTITYDLNGGTLNGETGKVTVKAENGSVITLPEPTRDGYTFDYWEGSKYNAGDQYTVNGDHTFKAVWKTGGAGSGKKGSGTKTGDENTLGAWIVLLFAALTGTTGMVFARKRRND